MTNSPIDIVAVTRNLLTLTSEDRTQRYRNTSDLPASSSFEARSSHFQDNLGPRWLRGCCCLAYKDVILQTRVVSNCKRKRSQEEKETDQYHRPSVASSTTAALEAGGVKKAPTEKLIPVKVETIDEFVRMHKMYSATAKSLLKTKPRKQISVGPTQQQGILKRWNRRHRHRCLVQVALQLEFRVAA